MNDTDTALACTTALVKAIQDNTAALAAIAEALKQRKDSSNA